MSQKIAITIDPMGNPKVEAIGFVGTSCDAAAKPYEDALSGGKGGERTDKPEYSMPETQTEVQQTW
jgi:hypothetical protein